MLRRIITLAVALFLLLAVTAPKLYQMAQMKGWIPGAVVERLHVLDKWHQPKAEHHKNRDVYWVAIKDGDIRQRGPHRVNVTREQWGQLNDGDPIEIVYAAQGGAPHPKNGIFVSAGNFVFDIIVLIVEVVVIAVTAKALISNLRMFSED